MKNIFMCLFVFFSMCAADKDCVSSRSCMLKKAGGNITALRLVAGQKGGKKTASLDLSAAKRARSGSAILSSEHGEACPRQSPRQSPRVDQVAMHNIMHQRCEKEKEKKKLERLFYQHLSPENKTIHDKLGHDLFMFLQRAENVHFFTGVVKKVYRDLNKDQLMSRIIAVLLAENAALKKERERNKMDGLNVDGSPRDGSPRSGSPRVNMLKKEKGPSPRRIDSPKLRRLQELNGNKRAQALQEVNASLQEVNESFPELKVDTAKTIRLRRTKSVPILPSVAH